MQRKTFISVDKADGALTQQVNAAISRDLHYRLIEGEREREHPGEIVASLSPEETNLERFVPS